MSDARVDGPRNFVRLDELPQEKSDGDHFHLPRDSLHISELVDSIHDGLEFPTEEEKLTLRRVSDTLPWTTFRMLLVILNFHELSSDVQ